ncbi:MAG: hypothetical protein RL385_282 [Pseudomonadota bacterium]|jgi:hypothetical protein
MAAESPISAWCIGVGRRNSTAAYGGTRSRTIGRMFHVKRLEREILSLRHARNSIIEMPPRVLVRRSPVRAREPSPRRQLACGESSVILRNCSLSAQGLGSGEEEPEHPKSQMPGTPLRWLRHRKPNRIPILSAALP